MKLATKSSKIKYIIGIDEVGRGPIAGPVTLCAFLMPAEQVSAERGKSGGKYKPHLATMRAFRGVKDSKQLTPEQREKWFGIIRTHELNGHVGYTLSSVSADMIDSRGLSWAINAAVRRCLKKHTRKKGFAPHECLVLLDGSLKAPPEFVYQQTIIGGDANVPIIALASIVAKVNRDHRMIRLARRYPAYDFHIHKGYGTRAHYEALSLYGLCAIHRRSFLKNLQARSIGKIKNFLRN